MIAGHNRLNEPFEFPEEIIKLKDLMSKTSFNKLSDRALNILWIEFCNVQAANFLTVGGDGHFICFLEWLESGDDNDAWS